MLLFEPSPEELKVRKIFHGALNAEVMKDTLSLKGRNVDHNTWTFLINTLLCWIILFPSYAYSESYSEVVFSTTIIPCRIVSWAKYFISKVFTEVVCLLLALEMHSAYNVIAVEYYREEHVMPWFPLEPWWPYNTGHQYLVPAPFSGASLCPPLGCEHSWLVHWLRELLHPHSTRKHTDRNQMR